MNSHAWQQPVNSGDAYRRAGGRRMKAELRRFKLVPLLRRGYRAKEMAQELGVSVSTIRRDMAALLAQGTIAVVPRW
jgi:predicted ArsR family transcriptional regulator